MACACYHCGLDCGKNEIRFDDKPFCCHGCRTVYEILSENDLTYYYDLQEKPGTTPAEASGKFDFLDNLEIAAKLLEFDEENTRVISLLIPSIHCISCIWVLENLQKIEPSIKNSQVDFSKKTVRITFSAQQLTLKNLAVLLGRLGYEPYISLDDASRKKKKINRSLIYKLGVAGFAFGNVMFLSFPEYLDLSGSASGGEELWLERFKHVFRWMMFTFSLPVVFYSGWDYFTSAWKSIRSGQLNLDIPIALGIAVLFLRSTADIVFNWGSGFFDSLTGLVFFLLLGRFFQQKTYSYLSFERDYKSYFPIAVTRLNHFAPGEKIQEEQVEVYKIKKGDRILVRNNELLPVDAVLLNGNAWIDYSFVSGEAEPLRKKPGDKLFAGGRQQSGSIEVEVLSPVEQSYLTQLWSNEVFQTDKSSFFRSLTDRIAKRFTLAVLSIAVISTAIWLFIDAAVAFNVFTAVLIIACPCAIALAAPFTLGNLLRIFGRNKLYLREAAVLENMAQIDTIVFDKTGTLTSSTKNHITYKGIRLTPIEESLLTNTLRASNHPLSRSLYELLQHHDIDTVDDYEELAGEGITARRSGNSIRVGSPGFVGKTEDGVGSGMAVKSARTAVHISSNDEYKGQYIFQNEYRKGIAPLISEIALTREVIVLSGDNSGERENLEKLLPAGTKMLFDQKPDDKLHFIKSLQESGKKVMMVGDGLNDAGALRQSDVGIALSENINVFSPACDGIMDASVLDRLGDFLALSKKGIRIIKWSFLFSLFYNLIGLSFAVTGNLSPIIAAILMPLSSVSIVLFTTIATRGNTGMQKRKTNVQI